MTAYAISRETWVRPSGSVWACFELNAMDAPILRCIKTHDRALAWSEAGEGRFLVPFDIDHDPQRLEPEHDLFSISGVTL